MNKQTFEDPLKFFCLIANEVQHEKISPTLYKAFVDNKLALEKVFKKPELKKAIKEGKYIPFNPETFEQFVSHYLNRKSKELRVELQSYTSAFETEEKIKTYIIQQYTFLANYYLENRDSYYKEHPKGTGGNPQKAFVIIALKTIINNIETDYNGYLFGNSKSRRIEAQNIPNSFEELFYVPENANICLNILRQLLPPIIDDNNNYIGKNKGIVPLWVKILKNQSIIKHFKDETYKNILNSKIKGLNLSKDASEFRKTYTRVDNSNIDLEIKSLLSQSSQTGKLGK